MHPPRCRSRPSPRRENTVDRERSAVRFGSGQNEQQAGVHRFYGLYLHQLPVDGVERASKPAIEQDMNRFVKVRLYTDGDGEVYAKQQDYEDQHFGTVALPLNALLDSNGNTIDTSAGVTRDPNAFAAFLAKAK